MLNNSIGVLNPQAEFKIMIAGHYDEIAENYENILPNNFVLHGFAVDEGVRRNKGRIGAAKAPDIIRKNMSNFPIVSPNFKLLDFGNITSEERNLENTQENLAEKVSKILQKNGM